MRGTAHPLNTQWPYVADVPPPYRKMLLLFTGKLQTRRYTRFTPTFTLTWSLHGSSTISSTESLVCFIDKLSVVRRVLFFCGFYINFIIKFKNFLRHLSIAILRERIFMHIIASKTDVGGEGGKSSQQIL